MTTPTLPDGVEAVAIEGLIDADGELTPDPAKAVFGELLELGPNGEVTFVKFGDPPAAPQE